MVLVIVHVSFFLFLFFSSFLLSFFSRFLYSLCPFFGLAVLERVWVRDPAGCCSSGVGFCVSLAVRDRRGGVGGPHRMFTERAIPRVVFSV